MRHSILAAVLLLATAASASAASGWAVVSFGVREGTGAAGAGADETSASLGFHAAVRPEGWPVALMAGIQTADDFNFCIACLDETFNVELTELSLGVERDFEVGKRFRPWIGGGLSRYAADMLLRYGRGPDRRGTDDDWGLFAAGGARWTFGHFTTGLDARLGFGATVGIGDEERDLDYWEASWVVGVSW